MVIVSNRRLDNIQSGSAAYLVMSMSELRRAGYELHHVMAPRTAFGSRPWCVISPALEELAQFHWCQTVRIRRAYVSLSFIVWARFIRRLFVEACRRIHVDFSRSFGIRSLLSQIPSNREQVSIVTSIVTLKPDIVIVEYSSLGPVLSHLPEILVRAVLFHDSFARRAQNFRSHQVELDAIMLTVQDEAARVKDANLILHASQDELEYLSPFLESAKHVWLRPIAPTRRHWMRSQPPACLFMGADHAGNRDAIHHLLDVIWPLVRAQVPDARLLVVGAVGLSVSLVPDGVSILGRVDDLSLFAGPDIIGLAPIRLGSGVAIKVADYLGAGMAVIGYPDALSGCGEHVVGVGISVQTANAFAEAIIDLLTNTEKRHAVSTASLAVAETYLNTSILIPAIETTISSALELRHVFGNDGLKSNHGESGCA